MMPGKPRSTVFWMSRMGSWGNNGLKLKYFGVTQLAYFTPLNPPSRRGKPAYIASCLFS